MSNNRLELPELSLDGIPYSAICTFFVLSDCGCNPNGTDSCNPASGQCICKANVGGQFCDVCLAGFYNFSSSNSDGCEPCDCQFGASLQTNTCDITSGQCTCQRGFTGRDCSILMEGYYVPSLEILIEAEEQNISGNVVAGSNGPGGVNFTGSGFVLLDDDGDINIPISLPISLLPAITVPYCASLRYTQTVGGGSGCSLSTAFIGSFQLPTCQSYPSCSVSSSFLLTVSFDAELRPPIFLDSFVFRPQLNLIYGQTLDTSILVACAGSCIDEGLCSSSTASLDPSCEPLRVFASAGLYQGARCKFRHVVFFSLVQFENICINNASNTNVWQASLECHIYLVVLGT